MQRLFILAFVFSIAALQHLAALPSDCFTHMVLPGETLYGIAVKYKIKSSLILAANPELSQNPNLKIGQKICIPKSLAVIPQGLENNTPKNLPGASVTTNPIKEGDTWFHIVQKGESFYGICKTYQILAYDLISANNLPNTIITENQKLRLPKTSILPIEKNTNSSNEVSPLIEMTQATTKEAQNNSTDNSTNIINSNNKIEFHIVKKGDTYYSISNYYGLKPDELKKLNNLTSSEIKIGQKLKVINRNKVAETTPQFNDEDTIPANANVIEIAKELEKNKIEDKENVANMSNIPSNEKSKKQQIAKAKNNSKRMEEEQARLDLLAATPIKNETSSDISFSKSAERKTETINNGQKNSTKETATNITESKEQPKTSQNDLARQTNDVALSTEIKNDPHKPIYSAKQLASFEEEYANAFQNKSVNQNMKLQKQRGIGELSDNIKGNEYLAYYNGCEPGTILKITNLMSKRSTYVKVLGKTNNESMLIVSSKLASKLGVIENDFLVEVSAFTKN